MRLLRFLTLLGIALILGLAFAHVAELPGKLRLAGTDWLTVQHNLYIGFGPIGAVVEPLAILLAWTLAFRLRRSGRPGFVPALAAALCVSVGLAVWALVVSPVNAVVDGWTAATLPADWTAWRNRWEIGHAIHAALFALAFCLTSWAEPAAPSSGAAA
jgi:hypothetical protein